MDGRLAGPSLSSSLARPSRTEDPQEPAAPGDAPPAEEETPVDPAAEARVSPSRPMLGATQGGPGGTGGMTSSTCTLYTCPYLKWMFKPNVMLYQVLLVFSFTTNEFKPF